MSLEDLTGKKFGKLTVLSYAYVKNHYRFWECQCDCGNEKHSFVSTHDLKSSNTKSCGCINKERNKNTMGHSHDRLYDIWRWMKVRCYDKNNKHYKDYGGRGIIICDEWLNDVNGYYNFYNWAINRQDYNKNMTIDRIDVNGNYEPSNCRWVTMTTQARNRRKTIYYTYNNETKSLAEWCELYNMPYQRVYSRINYNGYTFEDALFTPIDSSKSHYKK